VGLVSLGCAESLKFNAISNETVDRVADSKVLLPAIARCLGAGGALHRKARNREQLLLTAAVAWDIRCKSLVGTFTLSQTGYSFW